MKALNFLVIVYVIFSFFPLAFAGTFRPVSIEQQVKEADLIVHGVVEEKESYIDQKTGLVTTKVYLMVSEAMGEKLTQKKLVVRIPGGRVGSFVQTMSGSPVLNESDNVLLFLVKDKEQNYWVNNLGLGKYAVHHMGRERVLVNQIFPKNPYMGQIAMNDFFELIERVPGKEIHRFVLPRGEQLSFHERMQKKKMANAKRKVERKIASIDGDQEQSFDENKVSTTWFLLILGLMGVFMTLFNKRRG